MTVYIWSGKNIKGVAQKGEMEAASEDVVRSQLQRRKIQISKIKKKPKDLFVIECVFGSHVGIYYQRICTL